MKIDDLIKNYDIVVFSKSYCPFCKEALIKLKKYAKENNMKLINIDLQFISNQGIVSKYLYNITNRTTVPNIFIKGKNIGGLKELNEFLK